MAINTTLTADLILKEAQRLFKNNTPFLQGMYRDYDGTREAAGAKAGESIRIRKPMKYTMRTGKTAQVQPNDEKFVTLSKSTQVGVDLNFSSAELTQDINRFSELYLVPAINVIASGIEVDIMTQAVNSVYNQVGSQGTDPASFKTISDAGAMLTNYSTPLDGQRSVVLNPNGMSAMVDSLKGLFQSSTNIRDQYLNAQMGTGIGFEFAETPNVPKRTQGTSNNAYLVNGANQVGSSIAVDTGTGTYAVGDVVTFPGVYGLNPVTKQRQSGLQQFTVTTAYAGGAGNLQISPEIILVGTGTPGNAQATVSNSPADNAVITNATGFVASATTAFNLAYHKNAFAFGTVDLEMPRVSDFESRNVVDGVSMRLVKWYDGINDDSLYRIDVLYGFKTVTPEWACRIAGA